MLDAYNGTRNYYVTNDCIVHHIIFQIEIVSIMQVRVMEQTVKEWSQNVDKLLLKHNWLLLFNIPKLLKLSKLLRSAFQPDSDAEEVMEEIGFLFCSEVQAREKVTVAIKVTIIALTLDWYFLSSHHLIYGCRIH